MKHYASVLVFIVLIGSSALASIGSYRATESMVVENLNTALRYAIAERQATWLTHDTIASYRRMQGAMDAPLAINVRDEAVCRRMSAALRDETFVQLQLLDARFNEDESAGGCLCSDTIVWTDRQQNASIAIRSVARCSQAAIFSMSDQRLPVALCAMSLLWATFVLVRRGKLGPVACVEQSQAASGVLPVCLNSSIGGVTMRDDSFFDNDGHEMHLTPMQRRLLAMFFNSPSRKLSQQDICSELWPKKDDASETLYALITRTKKAIEGRSVLRIEVDRGRGYALTVSE